MNWVKDFAEAYLNNKPIEFTWNEWHNSKLVDTNIPKEERDEFLELIMKNRYWLFCGQDEDAVNQNVVQYFRERKKQCKQK